MTHEPGMNGSVRADTIDDRVIGLTEGADDYIVKPFAPPELVEQPEYEVQGPCSDALWLKTFKSYSPKQANLNALQKNLFR
jgi:hypothetical protein